MYCISAGVKNCLFFQPGYLRQENTNQRLRKENKTKRNKTQHTHTQTDGKQLFYISHVFQTMQMFTEVKGIYYLLQNKSTFNGSDDNN